MEEESAITLKTVLVNMFMHIWSEVTMQKSLLHDPYLPLNVSIYITRLADVTHILITVKLTYL
jgi:hypothetical protein